MSRIHTSIPSTAEPPDGRPFARDKDARDVSQMLDAMGGKLDVPYVLRWVEAIVGTDTVPAQQLTRSLAQRSLLPDA